jgi:hypothetical protein
MKISTKFGPAAILMDNAGAKMGIVKKITVTMVEGTQEPVVMYDVHGNGNAYTINEKDAILLVPGKAVVEPVVVAPVVAAVQVTAS